MGWSGYALEDDKLRCSIDWASRELKDQTYIVFLFTFCFLVPTSVMMFSFVNVKRELRKMQLRASSLFGRESKASKDNIRAEKRHTRLAVVMCIAFIATWMPYALLSFWASFFTHIAHTPVSLGTTCAVFAKASTLYNPIIYTIMHKRFRVGLMNTPFRRLLCCPAKIHPTDTSIQDSHKQTGDHTMVLNQ